MKQRDLTWWALAGSGFFLLLTLVLGLILAMNLRVNVLGEHRFATLGVHLHIALAGWVFLVIVGVGRHLLPMFLLSHGARHGPAKLSVALVAGGSWLLALLHPFFPIGAFWVAGAFIAVGVGAFLCRRGCSTGTGSGRSSTRGCGLRGSRSDCSLSPWSSHQERSGRASPRLAC